MKKTALYDYHLENQAKMVEFAGYLLPIQYPTGVLKEHAIVREEVGLFDVSHMGKIWVEGEGTIDFLNYLLTNRFDTLKVNKMRYALLLNDQGGIKDDVLVYLFGPTKAMIVCNGANHQKDYDWISRHAFDSVTITDTTNEMGQVALQGPKAMELLASVMNKEEIPTSYYSFKADVQLFGHTVIVSRNGYTGEDGFEIYGNKENVLDIARHLILVGAKPCGLGARDTLRLEAEMVLYGHELDETVSPKEADLMRFVKMDKEFIGKEALANEEITRIRRSFKMLERGIARQDYKVFVGDQIVGFVTSATMLPSLKQAGGMMFIDINYSEIGQEVLIEVHNKLVKAKLVEKILER